jgi:GTP cyclohydrolase FolE2
MINLWWQVLIISLFFEAVGIKNVMKLIQIQDSERCMMLYHKINMLL